MNDKDQACSNLMSVDALHAEIMLFHSLISYTIHANLILPPLQQALGYLVFLDDIHMRTPS